MPKFIKSPALAALLGALLVWGCAPSEPDTAAQTDADNAAPAASVAAPEESAAGMSDSGRLAAVIDGSHRSEANKARDDWRNPAATLEFFGVTPDSTVMEIWPGGGWYTEILAPYLRDEGRYIAAGWDPESETKFIREAVARYQAMLDESPELYDQVELAVLMPPDQMQPVAPGSVDIVLTFRNIHNWMPRDTEAAMFEMMYEALKPGGVLGVVEHRGNPDVEQDPVAKSGYVNEAYAIELAEAAGFVLDARSEINANPADTRDHPSGVWTLPPTLRLGDEDRAKYEAIGESDRFTLRFVKPAG